MALTATPTLDHRVFPAVSVLALALFANQYVTLPKFKSLLLARDPGAPIVDLQAAVLDLILEQWSTVLTPVDWLIAFGIVAALGWLVCLEIRGGGLTRLLARARTRRFAAAAVLTVMTLLATRYYLVPGELVLGDSMAHLIRSAMVAQRLAALETPVWSNDWYGGYPLLEYYAPLFMVVTALLTLLLGDVHLATKLLLWFAHVGSALAMFAYLRTATRSALPALVGALAYVLAFQRVHVILYRGDLQLSVVFLLYPLILLAVERFLQGGMRPRPAFIAFSLLVALLIINHQGYALFGLVFLVVYLVARIAPWRDESPRLRTLAFFACGIGAALGLSAFVLVPFVFESHLVRGLPTWPFHILIPNPQALVTLRHMFRWSFMGDLTPMSYMGLSIGIFAVIALPHALRQRIRPALALTACALAALFMMRGHTHYNVKNVNFLMIYLAGLAAWAVPAIETWLSKRPSCAAFSRRWGDLVPARIAVLAMALLVVDLGPTTFHSTFRAGENFKELQYDAIRERGTSYKVVERQIRHYRPGQDPRTGFHPSRLGVVTALGGVQSPLGWFHEGAGRSFGHTVETVKQLHRDLDAGRLSRESAIGLYLLGVELVLFRDRYRYFSPPLAPSPYYSIGATMIRLEHVTPLVLSTRVVALDDVAGYARDNPIDRGAYFDPETYAYGPAQYESVIRPLINRMGVDLETATAQTLVSDRPLPWVPGPAGALQVDIDGFETGRRTVTVEYRSSVDAIGRLPYTHFPYLDVRVDGSPVRFFRSAMGAILVPLPAGPHVLTVRGVASPLRCWSLAFSGLCLVAMVILAGRPLEALLGAADRGAGAR